MSRISSSSTSLLGGAAGTASSCTCRRVSALISQKIAKLTIRNWIRLLRKRPMFRVTAPAFCASARVGSDAPLRVTKRFVKSMPPTARPMIGVKMSFTRLLTTAVKATPIMMPTARSITLPRMMKARNSSIQAGRWTRNGAVVRSLMNILPLWFSSERSNLFRERIYLGGGGGIAGDLDDTEPQRHRAGQRDAVADPSDRQRRAGAGELRRNVVGQRRARRHPVQHDERTPALVACHFEGRCSRP